MVGIVVNHGGKLGLSAYEEAYNPSSDVMDIFTTNGLPMGGKSYTPAWSRIPLHRCVNIHLISHYYPHMDRKSQERASKTIRCLETGEPFDAKTSKTM